MTSNALALTDRHYLRRTFVFVLLTCVCALLIASFDSRADAATNSTLSTSIRSAHSSELALLNNFGAYAFLPQNGNAINPSFTEASSQLPINRLWVAETSFELDSCISDIHVTVSGNASITHVANSAPIANPQNEPSVGFVVMESGMMNWLSYDNGTNLGVGQSFSIASESFSVSRETLAQGLKVFLYSVTRQPTNGGIQSSFTFSGTPTLSLSYDSSACPVSQQPSPTKSPQTQPPKKRPAVTTSSTTTPAPPVSVQGAEEMNLVPFANTKVAIQASDVETAKVVHAPEKQALPHVEHKNEKTTSILIAIAVALTFVLGISAIAYRTRHR